VPDARSYAARGTVFLHQVWLTLAIWTIMIALWIVLTFPIGPRTDNRIDAPTPD
jgi:hypothetical protein